MSARACVVCGGSLDHVHPNRSTCGDECRSEKLRQAYRRYRERLLSRPAEPRGEKFCSRCERTLPRAAFALCRHQVSGLQTYCRACVREYANQPEQREAERCRQRIAYLLKGEERRRRFRLRYLFDREFRARVNAANAARYHADPKGIYQRSRERKALREAWEHENARRCFCGKALPAAEGEEGQWFCKPACKVKCCRFVCGLIGR